MEFFDLVNISERFLEIVNPSTTEKIYAFGKQLHLNKGSRVLDFGSGYAESLVVWAELLGVRAVGVDVREHACQRARAKIAERGLSDYIRIELGNGAEYAFEDQAFDAVTCIGASFIWGGFRDAIRAMKPALKKGGRIGIGEPYWRTSHVPPEYAARHPHFHREVALLRIAREEGFDFGYIVRADQDDWDRYESGNWQGLLQWLKENPKHPQREEVKAHLQTIQDEYVNYGREHLGWAMYVLVPTE